MCPALPTLRKGLFLTGGWPHLPALKEQETVQRGRLGRHQACLTLVPPLTGSPLQISVSAFVGQG